MQTFRWGFRCGSPIDLIGGGVWATNGRTAVLGEPITLESILRTMKTMEEAGLLRGKVEKYPPVHFQPLMVMPTSPRMFFRDMEGV
jgi:hypothetical protein